MAGDDRSAVSGRQTWWLTLPLREERPLGDQERRALRRQWLRVTLEAAVAFAATPLALFGWMLALVLAGDHVPLALASFVAGPAATVACGLWGFQRAKQARLARRDLRAGTVQVFAGRFDDGRKSTLAGHIAGILRKAKLPLTDDEETVELYGGTGRLLRVNGAPYRGWELIFARVATDPVPAYAEIAAQWLDKVGETPDGAAVLGGQRELTPAELRELRRMAFRAWWHPLRWRLLILLWPGTLVVIGLAAGKPFLAPLCWLLALALLALPHAWRGIAFAGKLARGARAGHVVIVQVTAPAPASGEEGEAADGQDGSPAVEMLAGTSVVWTTGGQPAAWRRLPLSA